MTRLPHHRDVAESPPADVDQEVGRVIMEALLWHLPRVAQRRAADRLLARARTSTCQVCLELDDELLYLVALMADAYARPAEIAAIFPCDEEDILLHLVHRLIERVKQGESENRAVEGSVNATI